MKENEIEIQLIFIFFKKENNLIEIFSSKNITISLQLQSPPPQIKTKQNGQMPSHLMQLLSTNTALFSFVGQRIMSFRRWFCSRCFACFERLTWLCRRRRRSRTRRSSSSVLHTTWIRCNHLFQLFFTFSTNHFLI